MISVIISLQPQLHVTGTRARSLGLGLELELERRRPHEHVRGTERCCISPMCTQAQRVTDHVHRSSFCY